MDDFYKTYPIGYVKKRDNKTYLDILPDFRPALKDLEKYSHLIVLWWISGRDNEESRANRQDAPPNDCPVTGVFASRSPARPNPIGLTVVNILNVYHETGLVSIRRIDAFTDSPIIDLKGYLPSSDRVEMASVPKWFEYLPKWLPEDN
ncbi:MAG: tRNA (N6-threonylcarbamoyladenosine(37)-N6)-methyltransferase TrmO [Candidatus Kariarchaeaceae archaeon]|jgi:tRNA-Thr(GGU) m(6)t(6)A37 methyltransferase TsaA